MILQVVYCSNGSKALNTSMLSTSVLSLWRQSVGAFCERAQANINAVGFGDIVPTKQVYLLVTTGYIVLGMTLTTMCIDLAGTEYIRKIHYLGQKMDVAKTVVGGAMVRSVVDFQ